jgi:hypothetical protein
MPPAIKDLENYALSYLGSYMNTVKKERPEHLPVLARNGPYAIEVCVLPNGCFALLFTKAEAERVEVFERGWEYVESKISTGPVHLVTVYPHEKSAVADAIARGRRDAARDIRAVEDSDISKAVTRLEKIMDLLHQVEQGNKAMLRVARSELTKMKPIQEAMRNSGPEIDMLALVDAMKSYPPAPVSVSIDIKDKELLEKTVTELGDMSDLLRRVETQDRKLEDLEQAMRKVFSEYSRTIDERISKGLEVVLESENRKRLEEQAVNQQKGLQELESRIVKLETIAHPEKGDGVAKEVLLAVADIRENLDLMSARVSRIESSLSLGPRVRTLRK